VPATEIWRGWEDFSAEDHKLLDEARTLILQAETSCFLAWGEEWLEKLYDRARQAESLLHKVETSRRFTL
jgi:hypothetical protein